MKTPTENLVDEVKNWSLDDWRVLRDDPKLLSSVLSSVQKAAPEVFENVLRTVMLANEPDTKDTGLSEQERDLREAMGTEGNHANEPVTKDTNVPEQIQGLAELLKGW